MPHNETSDHANLGGSNRLLTSREAGALLGYAESTVRNHWKSIGLKAIKLSPAKNSAKRFRERDVLAFIAHRDAESEKSYGQGAA